MIFYFECYFISGKDTSGFWPRYVEKLLKSWRFAQLQCSSSGELEGHGISSCEPTQGAPLNLEIRNDL